MSSEGQIEKTFIDILTARENQWSYRGDFRLAEQFLFNWREPDNKSADDLYDFIRQVLSIPTAHEWISHFTILVDDKKGQKYRMVLRSYQIHAIKQIIRQISLKFPGGISFINE